MKNNFITKIIGATLAFAMMIGGAVGINMANNKVAREVYAANGDSVTGGDMSNALASGWTTGGTGTYAGNGIKFDGANDYIQSPDISSNNLKDVKVSLKAGHNGGSGSVLTIATYNASGTIIDSDEFVPTEAYTAQTTVYDFELTGSVTIKHVRITMTSKTKNLGMKYCEVFDNTQTGGATTHKLTYSAGDHGTYDGTTTRAFDLVESTGTQTVKAPSDVGISGNTGYLFDKWNDGNNDYNPGSTYTMGTADVTLTAQWVEGVALSYNGNGATSGSVATTYVVSGGTQTVAENGFDAPTGKEFKEWNTLSTGLGTSYNPGDEITNFTSALTLYAIWQNPTHVDFDATSDTGTTTITKSDITLTLSSGTLDNGSEYRFFKNSTLTISRTSGKIGSVVFTCTASGTSKYGPGCFTAASGEYTYSGQTGTWEGAANSITFTASSEQVRATRVVVYYYQGSDVTLNTTALTLVVNGSSSSISVAEISGVTNPQYTWARVSGDDCVTLTGTNSDTVTVAPKGTSFAACDLTLTVNGDNLQEPIVREAAVFVARSSSENAYNIAEAKHAIDLNNELYTNNARVAGIVSYIEGYVEADNAISYWISDDGSRTNELEAFKGKGLSGADFNAEEDVDLGASVVLTGNLIKYGQVYELASGNQMESYSITAETKVSKLDSKASLSYRYNKTGNGTLDILTLSTTGVSGTNYTPWSNKTGASGAIYAGQSSGGNSSIQLRSDNSNSGLITTTSGGNATKVTIVWNSNTANNRTINIYGKDTAYTAVTELYGDNAGTLLGTIKKGTSTELTISGDYQFIGIRSASGALYLDEIKIQWGEPVHYTFSDVAIRFGGSITPELWEELDTNEHNIAGFGVAWRKANTFEGLLKNNIANVETADGQGFYKLVSAKAEGHPDLVNGKYIWNFYLRISTIIDEIYDEHLLDDNITAVAYIKLNNGEVVYLKETTASVKTLAQALLDDDESGYDNSSLDGSLKYLADLTF